MAQTGALEGARSVLRRVPLLRATNRARVQLWIRAREEIRRPRHLETAHKGCVLCGNNNDFLEVYDPYIITKMKIVQCRNCGLKFLRPMPTQAFIDRLYSEITGTVHIASSASTHFDAIPAHMHQRWRDKGKHIFGIVKKYIDDDKGLEVLEVGAAHGATLEAFHEHSGEVRLYALEIDPRWDQLLAEKAIRKWADHEPGKTVDVLIISHVLEHFLDPVDELTNLRGVLADDGLLYVEVPNEGGPTLHFKLQHNFYFSRDTLLTVCKSAGFTPLEMNESENLEVVLRKQRPASGAAGGLYTNRP